MTMADAMRRLPGLCAIALGLGIAGYAGVFPEMDGGYPGPGMFPRLVGIGLAACGLALVWRPGSAEGATEGGDEMGWLGRVRFAAGLLLVIAFPWLHSVVGASLARSIAVRRTRREVIAAAIPRTPRAGDSEAGRHFTRAAKIRPGADAVHDARNRTRRLIVVDLRCDRLTASRQGHEKTAKQKQREGTREPLSTTTRYANSHNPTPLLKCRW